ncbi:MAG: sigma-70 family RNA polymerase sigma factor [Oscillospiraceae bacterium]|nr:sigma-70 family RNA polymerase sigma factor [Oscillospiraceae bacterium]
MGQVSLARDETAAVLLDRYGDMILRLAFSCMKNMPDAEDVLQDVFLKLLEKTPVFESDEHRKAWLIRVTVNICRSRLRSPWRRHKELEEADASVEENRWLEGNEVLEAVMALPEKYREVIHLFYYEDYSVGQIAALLGKKEATVRSLMFRARTILKDKLKGAVDLEESV